MPMTTMRHPTGFPQPRQRETPTGPMADGARARGRGRDDVLDAGLDSFPASDPPSWSPLTVGATAA